MITFPDPKKFRLVVAGQNEAGEADFLTPGPAAEFDFPGVSAGAFYWAVEGGHSKTSFGAPPAKVSLAGPNGSTFGVSSFPAHSSGEVDASTLDPRPSTLDPRPSTLDPRPSTLDESMSATEDDGDAGMHASDTIDYEVVISGKVDLVLPGGKKRTLVPGDLLVMASVPHAWKNPYDEDCVYIVVTVGFNTAERAAA
ncbi:cupin domain-containing protein [Streptomyces sp. 2A115]|uniref:cupin domain-containing protein n=1 Tax=Streptomyces sp. 2A115 TaxID=3457439 RepID=UPI003FCFFD6A